ncbi:MAG: F0F1 ATP synthase subunit B [Clostridia bacterium]|nr:F0F1 ATP synthase subunit B [Clostridia bacterium]
MPFISVDTWTLIFTWVNLLILFFIVKKLFMKPIQKMLDDRNAEVQSVYAGADAAEKAANEMKDTYEKKLSGAEEEAAQIVSNAVESASNRSDSIVKEAEDKAAGMIERAQKTIEAQKESAYAELKGDVSSMAVEIAQKIIEKDIDESDHEKLIAEALEGLGGSNE